MRHHQLVPLLGALMVFAAGSACAATATIDSTAVYENNIGWVFYRLAK